MEQTLPQVPYALDALTPFGLKDTFGYHYGWDFDNPSFA